MGKLIFFDIDGTLAVAGGLPSEVTVQAIRDARNRGNKVFISTGRTQGMVPQAIMEIGFDGGIYSAGGRVLVGDTVIFDRAMPKDLSQNILDAATRAEVSFTAECGLESYCKRPELLRQIGVNILVRPIEEYGGEPIYKVSFLSSSADAVDFLRRQLDRRAKLVCFDNMMRHLPFIPGEISDSGVNKGNALWQICEYFGVGQEDCIAFGDSMNDAEMLQTAGIGVAMGNAETRVKEIADQVCECCEEDGVAKALARMELI